MAGIKDISKAAGINEQQMKGVIKAIVAEVKKGGNVMLKDFGTFKLKAVPERQYPNPQTGEKITKAAHNKLVFKPSANLEL